ncbi:MAG: hypothetical protein ACD_4C00129G0001 [uncultured bacterium (gcode 4)]|uniref:Uncharacterized protein n=1 Tax=uncultured bacterium (gcode 4) TaxID=1234023 RepID=K2G9P5_9BACT|nr:MAG: hypothetical protein ACD_4C00129G0001 [uncultured bacterium (gcode 4)]
MNKAKIIVLNALNKKFKEFFALKPEEQAKMVWEFFGNIEFTILSWAWISKLVRSVFVRANISHGAKTEILWVEAKKFTYKQSRKALEIFAKKLKNAENLDEYKKLIVQVDKIKWSNLNWIDLLDMIEKVESWTIQYKKLPKLIRDDVFYLLKHWTRISDNAKKSWIAALSDSITKKAEVAWAKFIESSAWSIYLKVEELAFWITDLLNNSAMKGISMISSAPNESVIYLKKCLKELLDPNSDKLKFLNKHKPRIEKILREFNEKWILEQHEVFNDKLIWAKIKEKFVRTLKFENWFALDFDKKTSTWWMRNLQKKFIIQPNYNYLSSFYEWLAVWERFEWSRKITEILDKSWKILFSEKDINSTYIKWSLIKIEKSDWSTFIFGKNDFKNKLIELKKWEKAILWDDWYVSVKKWKQNSVYALNESSEWIQCLSEISWLKAGEITRLSPKSPYYKLSVNTPNWTKYQIAIDPSASSLEASLVHIDESKLFDEIISFKKWKWIVKIDWKYHLVKAEKDWINFRFLSHIENIWKFDKDWFASVTFKPFKDEWWIVRQFWRISETGELEVIKLEAKNGVFIESIWDYHRWTAPFKIETWNKKISKWWLIDENKNVIQWIEFDRIHPFSEGYAKVELNWNQWIIDIYWNMVIEPKFKEVVAFLDWEWIVFDGKTYFSYSQTKKTIEKLNIDWISYKKIDWLNRDQSILITKKWDLFWAVDIQWNEILSPTYSNIELSKIEWIFEVFEKDDKIWKIKDFRSEIRSRWLKSSTNLRTTKTDNFTNLLRLEYFNGSRKAMKNWEVIFEKWASPFIQTLGKAKLEDLMTWFYWTKEKLSENFSGLLKKFKKFDLYEYQSQKHQIEIEVKSTITKQMDWFTKKYFEKFNKIKLNNVELSELTRFINEKTREFMNSLENQFKHFSLDPRIWNVKNMEKIFGMFVNKMTKIDYINSRDSRELLFWF